MCKFELRPHKFQVVVANAEASKAIETLKSKRG
jgi:hypothetical protein